MALYRAVLVAIALGTVSAGRLRSWHCIPWPGPQEAWLWVAIAFVAARLLRGRRRVRFQIAATVPCAYGAYFAADSLALSGIFATIAFGIALRYFERSWITLRIAEDVGRFGDVAALLANGLVFFMVGAGLQFGESVEPGFSVACLAAIAVARLVVAGLLLPFPYPRDWLDVVRVAGMRGALSLALALALPASLPIARRSLTARLPSRSRPSREQLDARAGRAARGVASDAERIGLLAVERDVEAAFFGGFVDFDGRYEVDQREHRVREGEGPGAATAAATNCLPKNAGLPRSRPSAPLGFHSVDAKTPSKQIPKNPPTPWTPQTSSASSQPS